MGADEREEASQAGLNWWHRLLFEKKKMKKSEHRWRKGQDGAQKHKQGEKERRRERERDAIFADAVSCSHFDITAPVKIYAVALITICKL